MTIEAIYFAAVAADEAYDSELRRTFGRYASDVRYVRAGNGEPGSDLRRLSDEKLAADAALHAAWVAS